MSTPRLPDWPARLAALVLARLDRPFAWGPNDCAAFAADNVHAVTGVDRLAPLRGPRSNLRQACRLQRALGGMQAMVTRCGLVPVAPGLAQRGDLVLLRQGRHPVLAVCLGEQAASPGRDGLEFRGMSDALCAWRV